MAHLSCILIISRFGTKVFVEISFTEKDFMNLTAALRVWTWVESGALLLRHVAMSEETLE
jgi:hypothetical protein